MSMTFLDAAKEVAHTIGAQNDVEQQAAAKTALQNVIRKLNTKTNWEFKQTTLADIPLVIGTSDYVLTGAKRIHSLRLKGNKRTLKLARQRFVNRVVRDQETPGIPTHYIPVQTAGDVVSARLVPIPSVTDTMVPFVYTAITMPVNDGDILDVPERLIYCVLAVGKYIYLADRDAENPRTAFWKGEADTELTAAMGDDNDQPDEDFAFLATDEEGFSYGNEQLDPWS
jgi:hypothetical protein